MLSIGLVDDQELVRKGHASNLLAKLDCRDHTRAVLKAINLAIV